MIALYASLWRARRPVAAAFMAAALHACARTAVNVRTPLGAYLSDGASTGPRVPLAFDPSARVILSTAAGLPAASFSVTQADRGGRVYNARCGACHRREKFIGQEFVDAWNDRRVYDFYALVRATMPLSDPGSLKDGEYLDLVAYILSANQAVAGGDSLKADTTALKGVRISVHTP